MTKEREPQPGDLVKAYLNELEEAQLKEREAARRQVADAFRVPAALLEEPPRTAWQEQERLHQDLVDRMLRQGPAPARLLEERARHGRDEDCTVGADGCCIVCGVAHGAACLTCGGEGFHRDACAELEEGPTP